MKKIMVKVTPEIVATFFVIRMQAACRSSPSRHPLEWRRFTRRSAASRQL
jgi:hypothetical protein